MAYRVSGSIIIDNDGQIRNVGVATIGLIDGKVSEKAISTQTDGIAADVTGADEILLYDQESNALLKVSVNEFIEGSGIGTIVSEFGQLSVTGIATIGGQLKADGAGIGLTVANDAFIAGDLEVGGLVIAGTVFGDGQTDISGNLNVTGLSTLQGPVYMNQVRTDAFQVLNAAGNEAQLTSNANGPVQLFFDNAFKFSTANDGIRVAGVVTAQSGVVTYYGDGSNLEGVASSLAALTDVDLTGLVDDRVLVYDASSSCWVPGIGPAFTIDSNDNVYAEQLIGTPVPIGVGARNLILGLRAGCSLVSSIENVILGTDAAANHIGNLSGGNFIGGTSAGCLLRDSIQDNVIIGVEALIGSTAAPNVGDDIRCNVAIGRCAHLNAADSSTFNISIGYEALKHASINAAGPESACNTQFNIVMGANAGTQIRQLHASTILGTFAAVGASANSGAYKTGIRNSVFIGTYSGALVGSYSIDNTAVGNCSLFNVTGSTNTAFGLRSGFAITSGNSNTLLGYQAGGCVTTGSDNIIIGRSTQGTVPLTGSDNVVIGRQVEIPGTSACCLVIGNTTNRWITGDSSFNVNIPGDLTVGGTFDISIDSLNDVDTSTSPPANNCALVWDQTAGNWVPGAGPAFTIDANRNVYAEELVTPELTSGIDNLFLGVYAGEGITTGEDNILIGKSAFKNSAGANSQNVAIGKYSGYFFSGNCNTFLGSLTGQGGAQQTLSGDQNIAIGYQAYRQGTGDCNTAIGVEAGRRMTGGYCNVMLGNATGEYISTGNRNTIIGGGAGRALSTGSENTILGRASGNYVTTGNCNVVIGSLAASGGSGPLGDRNVYIGNAILSDSVSDTLRIGSGSDFWIIGLDNYSVVFNEVNVRKAGGGSGAFLAEGNMASFGVASASLKATYTLDGSGISASAGVIADIPIIARNTADPISPQNGKVETAYEFTVSPRGGVQTVDAVSPSNGATDYTIDMNTGIQYMQLVVMIQDDGGGTSLVDKREFYYNGGTVFSPGYTFGTTVVPTLSQASSTHEFAYTENAGVIGFLVGKTTGGGAAAGARMTLHRELYYHRDVSITGNFT